MTALGKILVLLNLALSVLLMSWALAVYTNRIDFSDVTSKGPTGEQIVGEWKKRAQVIENLWEGVRPAQVNWQNARAALAVKEAQQVKEWEFYHGEIDHNLTKARPNDPVRRVVLAGPQQEDDNLGVKAGLPLLDPATQLPVMAPVKDRNGEGVAALITLNAKLEELFATIHQVEDLHEKQIQEAIKETEKLIGPKGLLQRLVDEKQKRLGVLAEMKLARPQLINTAVESELIHKRHKQLVNRRDELKRIGVAVRDR
jgi:hypothetical protein